MNFYIFHTFKRYILPMICVSSSIILFGKGTCVGYPLDYEYDDRVQHDHADYSSTTMLTIRSYFDHPTFNLFGGGG